MRAESGLLLGAWGTLVGLDLASVPQVMIARPLVAGTVAGAILGDVATGLRLGVLFELFQIDILPLGAARYPEYGPATVASVAAAHAAVGALGVGLGVVVGMFTGLLGGISVHWALRPWNTRAVQRASPRLEAGDPHAVVRVHAAALARDAVRAAVVTTIGLVLAALVRTYLVGTLTPRGAFVVVAAATGAAIAAGTNGTLQLVSRRANLAWLGAGLVLGVVGAWLR
jgi:mannose/fructose/N-acetylgalactosamine-specific phosphotransferase system component IIC